MSFRVVETLPALPGACYFCGSGTKGKYIDCGTSIEFYGALYICVECVFAMSKLLGFLAPHEVTGLVEKNQELEEKVLDLEIERSALGSAVKNLAAANFGRSDLMVVQELDGDTYRRGSSPSPDSDSELLFSDDTEKSNDESPESARELVTGEDGTSKSSDDEGVDLVRTGSTGSGEFEFSL